MLDELVQLQISPEGQEGAALALLHALPALSANHIYTGCPKKCTNRERQFFILDRTEEYIYRMVDDTSSGSLLPSKANLT